MTRIPLRPLARILKARDQGENPDVDREGEHPPAPRRRCAIAAACVPKGGFWCWRPFFLRPSARSARAWGTGLVRAERAARRGDRADIVAQRADIVDRNGRVSGDQSSTYSLYAQPRR